VECAVFTVQQNARQIYYDDKDEISRTQCSCLDNAKAVPSCLICLCTASRFIC